MRIKFSTQLLGWLTIVFSTLIVIGALLEITARIMLPNINVLLKIVTPTADNRNYVLKPNASTDYSGLYEQSTNKIQWRINAQGIRTHLTIGEKSNDVYRIVTYGDSETFGWSVDLDSTWQRQMEQIDHSIEVINLGIPGYNIENIATHVEKTLSDFQPDLVIYLFNKNDVYHPLSYHPVLSKSFVYLIANMGIYQLKAEKRKKWRNSQDGASYFRRHLQRIIDKSEEQNVPLIFAIQHWKYIGVLPEQHQSDQSNLINSKRESFIRTINVEKIIEDYPRRDAHMTEPAHQALAQHLCRFISIGAENQCRPL